jgi:AraC-like DNA-binding protein
MLMRKWQRKNRSVLLSWLISYLSVLLVPILISSVIYVESARIVEREINQANVNLLQQLQQVLDNQLEDIEKLSIQLAWNTRLIGLMNVTPPFSEHHHYAITQIIKDFKLYDVTGGYVDRFYVALNNAGVILSPNAVISQADYFQLNHTGSDLSFEDWTSFLQAVHVRDYTTLTRQTETKTLQKTIAFTQSMPLESPRDARATIVILLDESRINTAINNVIKLGTSNAFIIDAENQVMAATSQNDGKDAFLDYHELPGTSGLFEKVIGDEQHIVSYITSTVTDWKYVLTVPSSIFMEKATYIRSLTIISVLLCIIVGGLVSYFFTRRNYHPVRGLLQRISETTGRSPEQSANEYMFINKAFDAVLAEKDEITNQLDRQRKLLRDTFIRRLIRGYQHPGIPVHDALASYEIQFGTEHFAVLLFYIEDYRELAPAPSTGQKEDTLELVQFIIRNVTEEMIREKHDGYMTEIDGLLACLVSVRSENKNLVMQELQAIAQLVRSFVQTHFRIYFTVAISNVHSSFAGIPTAYQEALQAIEYKVIIGSGQVITYDQIPAPQDRYDYSLDTEQQLINQIKAGDYAGAKQTLDAIFQRNFNKESLSVQMAKCLLFDLINTMIKAMNQVSFACETQLFDKLNPLERLTGAQTIQELHVVMTDLSAEICQAVQAGRKDHGSQLVEDIRSFVSDQFRDYNLSISSIAEQFNLVPSYLSRLYKEQSGESLLDTINRTRIHEAKRMLKDPDRSISDITNAVGYLHSNTFIRIFKRFEGVTPGRFREI